MTIRSKGARRHKGILRAFTIGASLLMFGAVLVADVIADEYPSKPIVLVSTSAAGGSIDVMARPISEYLITSLKTPVIIDNRPGGNGIVAVSHAARAEPDAYTLLIASVSSHILNPVTRADLPYDPDKDFTPLTTLVTVPYVLSVSPRLDVSSISEFVKLARQRPGELKFGASIGSPAHFAVLQLAEAADLLFTHVPYKTVTDTTIGVLNGDIDFSFGPLSVVASMVEQGQIKLLAVGSQSRMNQLPEVPTMIESGYPAFEAGSWYGLAAPTGSPEASLDILNREFNNALDDPEVVSRLEALGYLVQGGTREEFAKQIEEQRNVYGRLAEKVELEIQ